MAPGFIPRAIRVRANSEWVSGKAVGVLRAMGCEDPHLLLHKLKWSLFSWSEKGRESMLETCLAAEKIRALVECVQQTERIPGDIVECGVYRGGGTIIIAKELERLSSRRKIHGFDSFEGFPKAVEQDTTGDGMRIFDEGGFAATSEGLVRWKLEKRGCSERVTLYKGFFQDTLPGFVGREEKFSLVHIDCDQYEGTKFCLGQMYDRVNPGGMVLLDDYAGDDREKAPGVHIAVDEFMRGKPEAGELEPVGLSLTRFIKR